MAETETIKFREQRGRIDNLLLQISGLAQPTNDRISLLEALFKEFKHELTEQEVTDVQNLFTLALRKENMAKGTSGIGYERKVNYEPSLAFLNEIELELRRLLGKYGFYSLTKENKDYQLGEK